MLHAFTLSWFWWNLTQDFTFGKNLHSHARLPSHVFNNRKVKSSEIYIAVNSIMHAQLFIHMHICNEFDK